MGTAAQRWSLDLRGVACSSGTPRGEFSIPTWIRTRARTFGGSGAIRYIIGT